MGPSPWLPIAISTFAAIVSCSAIAISLLSYRLSRRNATLAEPFIVGHMTAEEHGPQICFRLAGPNHEAWQISSAAISRFSANRLIRPVIGDDGYTSSAIVGREPHSERKIVEPGAALFMQPLASLPVTVRFELRSRSNSSLRIWRTVKYTKMA